VRGEEIGYRTSEEEKSCVEEMKIPLNPPFTKGDITCTPHLGPPLLRPSSGSGCSGQALGGGEKFIVRFFIS
jgi:hypothetical protein